MELCIDDRSDNESRRRLSSTTVEEHEKKTIDIGKVSWNSGKPTTFRIRTSEELSHESARYLSEKYGVELPGLIDYMKGSAVSAIFTGVIAYTLFTLGHRLLSSRFQVPYTNQFPDTFALWATLPVLPIVITQSYRKYLDDGGTSISEVLGRYMRTLRRR